MTIFSAFFPLLPETLIQSMIMSYVAMGIMIPFRMLDRPDISCEGSFTLGSVVYAVCVTHGVSIFLSAGLGILAGAFVGMVTAFLHVKLRIHSLLASIVVITMLYSVHLRMMQASNLPLFDEPTFFDYVSPETLLLCLVLGIFLMAVFFFHTNHGLRLRAVGLNHELSKVYGFSSTGYVVLGFAIANALSSFSGVLLAQHQQVADINIGVGVLVNGLASLMIGEVVVGNKSVLRQLMAPFLGTLLYQVIISVVLVLGASPSDLKFVTGFIVISVIFVSNLNKSKKELDI